MGGTTVFGNYKWIAIPTTAAWLLCGSAVPVFAAPPSDDPITGPGDPRCLANPNISVLCANNHRTPPDDSPPVIHPTGPMDPACIGTGNAICVGGPYDSSHQQIPQPAPATAGGPPAGNPGEPGHHPPPADGGHPGDGGHPSGGNPPADGGHPGGANPPADGGHPGSGPGAGGPPSGGGDGGHLGGGGIGGGAPSGGGGGGGISSGGGGASTGGGASAGGGGASAGGGSHK